MLDRLPIVLAQLQAGTILINLEMKKGNYYIHFIVQKIWQNKSIKVWLVLFKKNGDHFYGYRE